MLKGEISGAMDGNCSTCDYPGISNLPVGIQMHVPIEQVFLVCNFFYLTNRKRGRCHDVMWNGRNGIVCDDRFTWYNGFAFEANLHAHRPYYSIPTEGRSKAWRQCRGTLSPLAGKPERLPQRMDLSPVRLPLVSASKIFLVVK